MITLNQFATGLIRSLVRKPGFALAVILTLTIGISANTATLSLLYGYLLAPLPYPQAHRLIQVAEISKSFGVNNLMSSPLYFDLQSQNTALDDMAIYKSQDVDLDTGGRVVHVNGVVATASFFTTLRTKPLLGRVFAPTADQPGAAGQVVLSYRLWEQLFNGNSAVLGRTVRLNDVAYTIIGIMPQSFQFPDVHAQLWIPAVITGADHNPRHLGFFQWQMIGRLKSGATLATFSAQAQIVMQNAIAHFPVPAGMPLFKKAFASIVATPLRTTLVGDLSQRLMLVQVATALLLLLVWFNLANLFIARALTRHSELVLRRVLGADTRTLFVQLFAESMALCTIGAVAGLIVGEVLLHILLGTGFGTSGLAFPVREWGVSIAIAVLLALLSALVFSLAGLYFIYRQDLAGALREGDARSSGGSGEHRIRKSLVITQLVLACVLTGTGAMLAHSLEKLGIVDLGFQPNHVITFQVHLPVDVTPFATSVPDVAPPLTRIYTALSQVPGISDITVANGIPFASNSQDLGGDTMFPYPFDDKHTPQIVPVVTDPSYFHTFGIPLLAGRLFAPEDAQTLGSSQFNTPQDASPKIGVAILDTTAARQLFGTRDVIGREFNLSAPNDTHLGILYKVIGLVGTAHRSQVGSPPDHGTAYLYRDQVLSINGSSFASPAWYVAIRTPVAAESIVPTLSQAMARAIPGVPIYDVRSMDERISDQLAPRRDLMTLVLMFALGALLLAAVGVYAVQSYNVSQRLREFGIRAALGASRAQLIGLVLREISKLLLIGLILGLIGVVFFGHLFAAALYSISTADPTSLFLVFVFLSFTMLVAGWIPAWRASRVPPMEALR